MKESTQIVIGIIFLFFSGINIILIASRIVGLDSSPSPSPSPVSLVSPSPVKPDSSQSAKNTTEAFYKSYAECLVNPPSLAKGKISEYCQVNNSYIGPDFAVNLKTSAQKLKGVDAVICAKNPPQDIKVTKSVLQTGKQANVSVLESSGSESVQILVNLNLYDREWKVNNITCLKSQ